MNANVIAAEFELDVNAWVGPVVDVSVQPVEDGRTEATETPDVGTLWADDADDDAEAVSNDDGDEAEDEGEDEDEDEDDDDEDDDDEDEDDEDKEDADE